MAVSSQESMELERLDQDNKLLAKRLVTVALPIALQSLIGASLNLVDNIMVGSLGEAELASVGAGVQIYFTYAMMLFGFTSGASAIIAQFYGVRDEKQIKATIGFMTTFGLAVASIFFFASLFIPHHIIKLFTDAPEMIELGTDYVRVGAPCFPLMCISVSLAMGLRGTQQTKLPMAASIIALLHNTFMNYCLIFGNFGFPKMGVSGAAFATVLSRVLETVILIYMVFFRENILSHNFKSYFSFSKTLVKRILTTAIPTSLNEASWGLGSVTCTAIYARAGITAFAAYQASHTINSLFILATFSIGDAVLILVGQRLGAERLDEAFALAKKLLKICVLVGAISGGLLLLAVPKLVLFFNLTSDGWTIATKILWVHAASLWMHSYTSAAITGVLRCGGDTKFALVAESATVWLLQVPIVALGILVFKWPIFLVFLASKFEEVIKVLLMFFRTRSGKWVKNMISDITCVKENAINSTRIK